MDFPQAQVDGGAGHKPKAYPEHVPGKSGEAEREGESIRNSTLRGERPVHSCEQRKKTPLSP